VIDCEGYRPNVGIILCNREGLLFWAKRCGQDAWQFPQGGIRRHESHEEAMYRELTEETGLLPDHVEIVAHTRGWLRYRLPRHLIRHHSTPLCIGQKQIWYMLRLIGDEDCVRLDACPKPEFDGWRWVDYWYPMREVVFFKRHVYRRALKEFAPLLLPEGAPTRRGVRRSPAADPVVDPVAE
jgi:putative (di)nucleoside polyphosphate hydrolase